MSDLHSGSKLAPINPETRLEDLNTKKPIKFTPTEVSRLVWLDFGEAWPARVRDLARGRPVHLRINGDVTQGAKHTGELYATSPAHQIEIARMVLDPWLSLPGVASVRFTAGTGSHEYEEGAATQILADLVRGHYARVGHVSAAYHYLDTVAGVRLDLAHHGPLVGAQPWTRANSARAYATGLVMTALMAGQRPPDVIARGHVHTPVSELVRVRDHRAWMVVCPALQYPNDHARRAARSPGVFTYGVTVLDIMGGRVNGWPLELWKTIDARSEVITGHD